MHKSIRTVLAMLTLGGVSAMGAMRPNIILVMADDMGYGDPSYINDTLNQPDGSPRPDRGWVQTPVLDEMAASGLRFDRFYAAAPVCSPTRASCLTGRHPYRLGVTYANVGKLGADETPLSEVLHQAGYRTAHIGKWHLGAMTTVRKDSNRGGPKYKKVYSAPWHHDYDFCFATESKVPTYAPYRIAQKGAPLPQSFDDPNFYGTYYWRIPEHPGTAPEGKIVPIEDVNNPQNGDDSKLLVDQSIDFIREAVADKQPFFLVLWFHTPHKPVMDPQDQAGVDSSAAAKRAIEDMDKALGRLRETLANLGVRNNTMLWFTSDNGPEEGVDSPQEKYPDHSMRAGGLRERKRSLYEGGIREPGILEWPDVVKPGGVSSIPAVTSDYYPTILDYLEINVPDQKTLDGISLRPLIEGKMTTRQAPIGFISRKRRAWITDRYKLVDPGTGQWELYDIPADPTEMHDLAAQHPDLVQNLVADFDAWLVNVQNDR